MINVTLYWRISGKSLSKTKQTFGESAFQLFTEVEGRFVDLLPKKNNQTAGSGQLH